MGNKEESDVAEVSWVRRKLVGNEVGEVDKGQIMSNLISQGKGREAGEAINVILIL